MNFNELYKRIAEMDQPVDEKLVGGQKKLDVDHDGDIEADDLADLRAGKKEVDECGPMGMPSMPSQQDSVSMNVSMNGSGQGGIRDLLDVLRNLEGESGEHEHGVEIEMEPLLGDEMDEEAGVWNNTPHGGAGPGYADSERMIARGDDMHSNQGDHRMRQTGLPVGQPDFMESLRTKLQGLYEEITSEAGYVGPGQSKPVPAAPAADPAKIQAEIDRFSKSNDMNIAANKQYVAGLQAKLKPAAPAGTTAAKPATGQTFAQNIAANKDAMKPGGATPPAQPGLPASVPGSVADITKQAAPVSAGAGRGGQGGPTAAQAAPAGSTATKPAAPAGAPKVAYEKDFPEATAKEIQNKLIAAGEKITADGKMGPATRAAMARHPEITSQPAAAQAAGADLNAAEKGPATVPPKPLAPGQMTEPDTPENDLSMFSKNAVPAPAAQQQTATDLANQETQAQANAAPPGEASYTPPAGAKPAAKPATPATTPVKSGTGVPVTSGNPVDRSTDYAGESLSREDQIALEAMLRIAGLR